MPRFRILEKSFIDNHLREEGEEVELDIEHDPKLHPNLAPVEAQAEAPRRGRAAKKAEDAGGDDPLA